MLVNSRTNKMTQNFGRVLISSIYNRQTRVEVQTEAEYMEQFKKKNYNQGGLCEIVGLEEFQVKPYFDLDPKGEDFDYSIIESIKADAKAIYDDEVFEMSREAREELGKIKHSIRLYIRARITYKNIPVVYKELFDKYDIIDKSVYNPNRIMFAPLSDRKKDISVPPLMVKYGSIFDCCATYIEEDYEDLDLRVQKIDEPKKEYIKQSKPVIHEDEDINDEDDKDNNDKYLKLQKHMNKMSERRATDFDTWIKFNWALMNIGFKENISDKKIERLIHQFSAKSKTNYDEDKVDDWIAKNPKEKLRESGYGWNYIYNTCLKEDAPDYYNKLTKSYYNVKKDFEKTHCKVIHPPMIVYNDCNENILQPIPLCEKSYRHMLCSVKETNKKGEEVFKEKRFIEKWLDDPQIRIYDKFVFNPPPLKSRDNEYNTWTDFEILQTPFIQDETVIEKFLDYMKNLLGNEEVVSFIIAYFANRLQNPAVRNMVCIILYGEEGDGKNRLLDIFKNIVGEKYFTELESGKQLFSPHSTIEKEKLFICVNEAKGKDNYENADILKARITTPTLLINPKGIQEFQINNYCDYLMTTNNHNAVNIHDKSRRYLFTETTSYYSRNDDFFNSFSKDVVENKNALRVIYEYLMEFDIKSVIPSGNFQNHIPITEIQKTIIRDNKDKIELFLRYLVDAPKYNNENDNDVEIKNKDLFNDWISWVDSNHIKIEYNSISFGTRLGLLIKKLKITEYIHKDTHSNTLINFYRLKEYFDNNL